MTMPVFLSPKSFFVMKHKSSILGDKDAFLYWIKPKVLSFTFRPHLFTLHTFPIPEYQFVLFEDIYTLESEQIVGYSFCYLESNLRNHLVVNKIEYWINHWNCLFFESL